MKLQSGQFLLCTIHRDHNTDIPERLEAIFRAMLTIATSFGQQVVIPLHPRTSKLLPEKIDPGLMKSIRKHKGIQIIPPVSYLDMILLEKHCTMILTDSGGVQKEAYFFRKPLIVARPETEWVEIIECGAGAIADADEERIVSIYEHFRNATPEYPPVFGDGNASGFICEKLIKSFLI
jgi:UDP-GlcNAc3NAcA epimerase